MNRQQCEAAILEKMKEIVEIYHRYHPEGKYLSLTYIEVDEGEYIQFNNRSWQFEDEPEENGEDVEIPINMEVNIDDGVT